MENNELILTGAVSPPVWLEHLSGTPLRKPSVKWNADKSNGFSEDEKKQIAKNFESVLLSRLLDEMKNTIGDWGFDKDGAAEQVQGIFWLHLASHLADSGGFGLWKDVYQFLNSSENPNPTVESTDANV